MSSLETKSIKQKVINNTVQPLYIGGIQPDHSDAALLIDASRNVDINVNTINATEVSAEVLAISGELNLNSITVTGSATLPSSTSIGNISNTELSYLDGVTSPVQTQLNTKASTGKAIAMALVFGG